MSTDVAHAPSSSEPPAGDGNGSPSSAGVVSAQPGPDQGSAGEDHSVAGGASQAQQPAHGYFESLPSDLRLSDFDRDMADGFAASMHKLGAAPDVVHEALRWHQQYTAQSRAEEERFHADAARTAAATLRDEWGTEAPHNFRLLTGFLDRIPPAVRFAFETALTEDGVPALADVEVVRWLTGLARGGGPAAPSGKAAPDELRELEEMMRDRSSAYWRGPTAAQKQARYRDLLRSQDSAPSQGRNVPPNVTSEIAAIEKIMKSDRRRYNRDLQMQSRLRELYAQRDGAR